MSNFCVTTDFSYHVRIQKLYGFEILRWQHLIWSQLTALYAPCPIPISWLITRTTLGQMMDRWRALCTHVMDTKRWRACKRVLKHEITSAKRHSPAYCTRWTWLTLCAGSYRLALVFTTVVVVPLMNVLFDVWWNIFTGLHLKWFFPIITIQF